MASIDERTLREIERQPLGIVPRRKALSTTAGEWVSPFAGKGFEFYRFRDYGLGDDLRRVHVPATVRSGVPTIAERVASRDIHVLVALDCTASMRIRAKFETLLIASLLLLRGAVNLEIRFGAALVDGGHYLSLGMGMGMRHYGRLSSQLLELGSVRHGAGASPGQLPPADLRRTIAPGALLFHVSDFLDTEGGIVDFSRNQKEFLRYDFVPVVIQDRCEYSFPHLSGGSVMEFANPETGGVASVWVGEQESLAIQRANEERFARLKEAFAHYGIQCIHLSRPSVQNVRDELAAFFAERRLRVA